MGRMVTLSSSVLPSRLGCPAQHALRLVCQACFDIPGRPMPPPIRLLVPAEQVLLKTTVMSCFPIPSPYPCMGAVIRGVNSV